MLGLFLELRVGLFQFGLLLLESRLRFLQRPALFFEFLIRDAQLLALNLQLLGLALGFYALSELDSVEFGTLSPDRGLRLVIASGTAILLAYQIAYGAFFLSVLEIRSGRGSPSG